MRALREPHFQCISSSASGPDTCHGPWTGDNRYGDSVATQIWKHCFSAAARSIYAVLCSGKAYFTLFVHIAVIYLLARMWSKNHETPGGEGSIFQKWSCRSSPWPQRLTTWQVLFNSQKTGQISSFKGDSCFEPLTQQTIMSHVTCFCYFRYILEVTWEFPRCSPQPAYPKTII